MRWLLNSIALIFVIVGINAVYGSFGENVVNALYSDVNVTQDMILEIMYFNMGLIFLGFAVIIVAIAYTLKKIKELKAG